VTETESGALDRLRALPQSRAAGLEEVIYEASFDVKHFFEQTSDVTPRSVCVALLLSLLFDMRLFGFTYRCLRSSMIEGGKPRSIIYAVSHHEVYSALSRYLTREAGCPISTSGTLGL
jgi:hypothetical protein